MWEERRQGKKAPKVCIAGGKEGGARTELGLRRGGREAQLKSYKCTVQVIRGRRKTKVKEGQKAWGGIQQRGEGKTDGK